MADNLIPILSPDGQPGTIPAEQLNDALGQGYSIPPLKLQAADLTPNQKGVNVYSPDGTPGIIPLTQLRDAMEQGYQPQSFTTPGHMQKVAEELKKLQTQPTLKDMSEEHVAAHANDDILDKDKKLKMVGNGQELSVPYDQVSAFYSAGYRFKDENFQALLEAQMKRASDAVLQGVHGGAEGFLPPLSGTEKGLILDEPGATSLGKPLPTARKAELLANKILGDTTFSKERQIGRVAGALAQIPATGGEGLSGEFGLGQEAKAAAIAGLAPEGAGIAQKVGAHVLGGALEGAIVTTPQALAQAAIDRNTKAAAETLGLGIGLGGLLGVGGGLIRGAEKAVPELKATAVDDALRELGVPEEHLNKLGMVDQKEQLLNKLIDSGLTEKSSAGKIESTLEKLASPMEMESTLKKLDPYLEQEVSANSMAMKIADSAQKASVLDANAARYVEPLTEKLNSLADKSGNISLSKLGQFVNDLGEDINWRGRNDGDVLNTMKKQIHEDGMQELVTLGDKAAASADPKVATEWASNKYVAEMAKQIHTKLIEPVVDTGVAVPGVFKSGEQKAVQVIKSLLTHGLKHKVAAAIGGALGIHGGPLGMVTGAAIGAGISKIGSKLVEHYVSNPENTTKLGSWLTARANHPAIASYLALDAMHSVTQQLEKIPEFMTNLGTRTAYKTVQFATKDDPVKQILGNEANGLSKEQQLSKLSNQLTLMAANPEMRNTHTAQAVTPFAVDHGALAAQLKDEMDQKIMYLHSIAPKGTPDKAFQPERDTKPSAQQYTEFLDLLKVAQNPFVLLDNLKEGKVTAKQVAVASQLNPEILSLIRDKMYEAAYSGKADLTYQQRLSASVIMGQSMDPSFGQVQALQSAYGPTQQASAPAPPPPKQRGKGGSHINPDKLPGAQYTQSQRLTK